MENLKIKAIFILDQDRLSKESKPSENDIQDAKILFYYPNNEDIHIKRSNSGIIEGCIQFFDIFKHSEDKFFLSELDTIYYIADRFEKNKIIVFIIDKCKSIEDKQTFSFSINLENKKNILKNLINNFYDTLFLFHNSLSDIFEIKNNCHDIRDEKEKYDNLIYVLTDFIENYIDSLVGVKIRLLDNLIYFPLNQASFSKIYLNIQRLAEKIPDIKYTSLIYKGHIFHNEIPLDSMSILFNTFYNNFDSSNKYHNFGRPSLRIVQTIMNTDINANLVQKHSNYRKCFEIQNDFGFLFGISKLNVNNYQYFIPEIYIKSKNEVLKLIVFEYDGLMIFLFLKESFNLYSKLNLVLKLEKYIKRYFKADFKIFEQLLLSKIQKKDDYSFYYSNLSNKSLKLTHSFYDNVKGGPSKEFHNLIFVMKNFSINPYFQSITFYQGKYFYYIHSFQRKIVFILDNKIASIQNELDEAKNNLFDKIFIF